MTVSIRKTLSRAMGGSLEKELTWPEVSAYLRMHYLDSQDEKERRKRAEDRQRLYEGGGDDLLVEMLGQVFEHPDVIQLRQRWVKFAKHSNPLRRICGELATVYQRPATRTVEGDENNTKYQDVIRECQQDEVMQAVNPLLILHSALAIGPRMQELPSGEMRPKLDVLTPASFTPVRDPLDPSLCIAIIVENDTRLALGMTAPKWTVWTWHESFMINSGGSILENTIDEHGCGELPYVLFTLDPPLGKLIDEHTGEELVACHLMKRFLDTLHAKEAKSATKVMVFSGDLSRAEHEQAADTERDIKLPEGVQATQQDKGMDFSKFLADGERIYEGTAADRGIPPSVLRHGAVASAEARELVRVPLREQRLKQQVPFRRFERSLVRVLAKVVSRWRSDLAFKADGWSIDFSDPQTPLGSKEALEVFEHERRLGLTNTIAEMIRRNPDLTWSQAVDRITKNVMAELIRNTLMRPLQAISGSPGVQMPDGNDANPGAEAAARAKEDEDDGEGSPSAIEAA